MITPVTLANTSIMSYNYHYFLVVRTFKSSLLATLKFKYSVVDYNHYDVH